MNLSDLKYKNPNKDVVIITGGGSGIGRSTAILLARKGYKTVIVGRNISNLLEVEKEVKEEGAEILVIQADINDPSAANGIVYKTLERFLKLDILINNAGVPGEGSLLHSVDDEIWSEIMNTNLTAAFRLIRAALLVFMSQKSGNIINVSSIAANVAMTNMAIYSCSKAGLSALTRSIALDYASYGIRCNSVLPGTIITDMTRSVLNKTDYSNLNNQGTTNKYIGSPEDIAQVIAFLCSKDSSFINGSSLIADGGKFKI